MTFSIYKKTVAVIFGLFMFVFSQLVFSEPFYKQFIDIKAPNKILDWRKANGEFYDNILKNYNECNSSESLNPDQFLRFYVKDIL